MALWHTSMDQEFVLTHALVRRYVADYRAVSSGFFPNARSGKIPGTRLSWGQIDQAMKECLLGWTEPQTLKVWLDTHYPKTRGIITEKLLRRWHDAYLGRYGTLPKWNLKERIPGTQQTWAALHSAMAKQWRGWSGPGFGEWQKIRYPDVKKRQHRHRTALRNTLKPAVLRPYVEAYRAGNIGVFPTIRSGSLPGTSLTWSSVHETIRNTPSGVWGAAKSLSSWLDQEYPAERVVRSKNSYRGVSFTAEDVRKWVDAYRKANNDHFPNVNTGQIAGTCLT